MFEKIKDFVKKINNNGNNTEQKALEKPNKEEAKERLHLVLMQDRANVSADFLDMMKQEIIDVIKKYFDVDENEIDVKLTNKLNSDGTVGAPALYANIPIKEIKNDARKINNKTVIKKAETEKANAEKEKAKAKEQKQKEAEAKKGKVSALDVEIEKEANKVKAEKEAVEKEKEAKAELKAEAKKEESKEKDSNKKEKSKAIEKEDKAEEKNESKKVEKATASKSKSSKKKSKSKKK